jgi:hypothetical protein
MTDPFTSVYASAASAIAGGSLRGRVILCAGESFDVEN